MVLVRKIKDKERSLNFRKRGGSLTNKGALMDLSNSRGMGLTQGLIMTEKSKLAHRS